MSPRAVRWVAISTLLTAGLAAGCASEAPSDHRASGDDGATAAPSDVQSLALGASPAAAVMVYTAAAAPSRHDVGSLASASMASGDTTAWLATPSQFGVFDAVDASVPNGPTTFRFIMGRPVRQIPDGNGAWIVLLTAACQNGTIVAQLGLTASALDVATAHASSPFWGTYDIAGFNGCVGPVTVSAKALAKDYLAIAAIATIASAAGPAPTAAPTPPPVVRTPPPIPVVTPGPPKPTTVRTLSRNVYTHIVNGMTRKAWAYAYAYAPINVSGGTTSTYGIAVCNRQYLINVNGVCGMQNGYGCANEYIAPLQYDAKAISPEGYRALNGSVPMSGNYYTNPTFQSLIDGAPASFRAQASGTNEVCYIADLE